MRACYVVVCHLCQANTFKFKVCFNPSTVVAPLYKPLLFLSWGIHIPMCSRISKQYSCSSKWYELFVQLRNKPELSWMQVWFMFFCLLLSSVSFFFGPSIQVQAWNIETVLLPVLVQLTCGPGSVDVYLLSWPGVKNFCFTFQVVELGTCKACCIISEWGWTVHQGL